MLHLTPSPDTARPAPSPKPDALSAKRLKVTTLDPTELLAIAAPEGKPRVTLYISLPDRTVSAEIAAKSLHKAQAAIREHGADNIALVLQGRLVANDAITEAGLSAQSKTAKAPARDPMEVAR